MQYRARDLFILPGLLSLSRIPLAVCFRLLVDRPVAAAVVLALAGLSDVLDGWIARRYRLVSATGMVLDPITDKLFVLTVAVTLVVRGHLSIGGVLLLSTREIGELPLVAWLVLSRSARSARAEQPSANIPGKFVTVLQFVAVCWAIFRGPLLGWWLAATAVAGVLAAISYWGRSLRTARYRAT